MRDPLRRWSPYIAAALLASLTIRVFFTLQDYGPESAIRRFYAATPDAVRTGNVAELVDVSLDAKIQGLSEAAMVSRLARWRTHGVPMQVEFVQGNGNEVRAVVVFSLPLNKKTDYLWASVWVVVRIGKDWKIDVNKTSTIFWDAEPPQ